MMTLAQSRRGSGHPPTPMHAKKRLGEMLMDAGVIDAMQLEAALAQQRKSGGKLGQTLVRLGIARENQIVEALSRKLGCAAVDVTHVRASPSLGEALRLVPREVAERHLLVPIACDARSVTIVMSDPTNVSVIDEIAFRAGRRVVVGFAGDGAIAAAIRRVYASLEDGMEGVAMEPTPRPSVPVGGRSLALALDRACRCAGASADPSRLLVGLVRVLLRKDLVTERELTTALAELHDEASARAGPIPGGLDRRRVA